MQIGMLDSFTSLWLDFQMHVSIQTVWPGHKIFRPDQCGLIELLWLALETVYVTGLGNVHDVTTYPLEIL